MRLVLIADTHAHEGRLEMPGGDGLIVAGDITNLFKNDYEEQVRRFVTWLKLQPYEFKAVIGGNHDFGVQRSEQWVRMQMAGAYLRDEEIKMGGLRVWGSPWMPAEEQLAFNLSRSVIGEKWDLILAGIDVLVTHGPPYSVLDETPGGRDGDEKLSEAVRRVQPALHVFGHIHEGHGTRRIGKTLFVNASVSGGGDMGYTPILDPIVVDLEPGGRAEVVSME